MPGRASKFTSAQNADMELSALVILTNSDRAMTINEIQHCDMSLNGYTQQKMARVLNNLVEKGFAIKSKNKENNRVMFEAVR